MENPQIVKPILASGEPCIIFGNRLCILFPYIGKEDLFAVELSHAQVVVMAQLLSELHAQVPPESHTERFLVPRAQIAAAPSPEDTPYQAEIKGYISSHGEAFLRAFKRLEQFSISAKALNAPAVFCHADPEDGNLVLDSSGTIHLIDWDNAKVAPAEQDIWFFLEHHATQFLEAYLMKRPGTQLHPEIVGYYFYDRNLQQYLVNMSYKILFGNYPAEQQDWYMRWLRGWWAELPQLGQRYEKIVDNMREALNED
jgi:thiamine kinase-like enzyme